MKLSSRILASAAAIGALAVVPTAARAATVSVEESPGNTNVSTLHFAAAGGERNQVLVTHGPESAGKIELVVKDAGAPLQAGPGCSGGGPAGSTVSCLSHAPKAADNEYCGRDCVRWIPGTAWEGRMRIELGDGNDSFDGSSFANSFGVGWTEEVEGGSGDDVIATGGGADRIVPGPGNDVVAAGTGADHVVADATPDGNDVLDLGTDELNYVDDSARTEPLHLAAHSIGGPGNEADTIEGFAMVIGGSGNDDLVSGGEWLDGGPGDDTLVGSPGDDYLEGAPGNDTIRGEAGDDHIYGGGGDDLLEGGAGNDLLEEHEETPELELLPQEFSGGTNRIYGGEGDDYVQGGTETDSIEGGPGDDRLFGFGGNDTIEGGAGNDEIGGDEGADVLRGGEGDDRLLAGYNREFLGKPVFGEGVDTGADALDCGPGTDVSQANAWDRVENCEGAKTVRALRVKKVLHDTARGTATVRFAAYELDEARVKIAGTGVRPTSASPVSPEESRFVVRAQGPTRAKLHRQGRATVTLRITWQLGSAPAATETRRIQLVEKTSAKRPTRSDR